ncbi:MAG: diguanylate cyclase [Chitinivibrionales bacterium]|nr:diguanylate cyclase [Chitinivibrionales bacterium]
MVKLLKFSYNKNNDKGLSVKQRVFWLISGLVILCAFFVSGILWVRTPFTHILVFALSVVWLLLMLEWFTGFLLEYARRIEKAGVTTRRYQNIAKYFESILQDSTDIIFTIDSEGLILKFNKGSQIHFGYTQEEIVGKPFSQLFVNEAGERKIMDSVLRSGKSVNEEIPMKTRDGEIIHLNLSISEMKDESGRIIGMVVTAKDITEKKKLELELVKKNELLEKLAVTDSLTELFNTRHFYGQIKKELARFRRNPDRSLSLMLMDIDHFKDFNDTEGHQMGDQVLKSLAQVINVCIRKDIDTGYRYGGDEFVVLLPDTDKHQAQVVAKRISKQFGSFQFGKTSLSIGIAQAAPEEDEVSLLKRADEAMYRSKKGGRSRISF